ncbi:dihydropyrimidine dehydrogenase [Halovenus sp. WSH3]|uniref:Dihydropyrimidine dehydrogenase n=1 Tax=Halovenus carboxidivorans TaxID=2692199 RepID=A0A6B0SZW1_9EURY|nr:tRNA-dihydrouridine synthase [Halovenus carboxidivorans]MXR51085.1 dihydropyrimidine dehydrogenase [Halovenus carboxidivorans]
MAESDRQPAFDPPVALASLSGKADAEWAKHGAEYVGAAFLGGIALDGPTRAAARDLVDRDRTEFLPPDPVSFVDDQLAALDAAPLRGGFNVRTTALDPLARAASVCADHGAIVEINAHCRQEEMCAAGAGETLLRDEQRLTEQVRTAAETGAAVSVKVRAEVSGVSLPDLAPALEAAGAEYLHVDAMDSEPVIADLADATSATIIANNEVRGRESVEEYLSYGADAVSVGRPSDDPRVLGRVRDAAEAWFEEVELRP